MKGQQLWVFRRTFPPPGQHVELGAAEDSVVVGLPAEHAFDSNYGFETISREERTRRTEESTRADMERRLADLQRERDAPDALVECSTTRLEPGLELYR